MKFICAGLLSLFLIGCMPTQIGSIYPATNKQAELGRDFFLVIDGTANNQTSRTNAARLFEMVDARSGAARERSLATYYAEGVGSTKGDVTGLALGTGMSEDVRNAYFFLTSAGFKADTDRIFLSGFSRGAYGVRVLNGLIAIAGIPDLASKPAELRRQIVDDVFDAYKSRRHDGEELAAHNERRRKAIEAILQRVNAGMLPGNDDKRVEAMAIWDTVEALGRPDGTEDPAENLTHYYITTCNIRHLFHALALDDNRAYSFTPIFAAGDTMREGCSDTQGDVQEVWFAGAHADVGGSYDNEGVIDGYLPGVSLNWMLERLRPYELTDPVAQAYADPFGPIHDARAGSVVYKPLYRNFRDPLFYHARAKAPGRPLVHHSAFDRLAKAHELDARTPGCSSNPLGGNRVRLCGSALQLFGFVPELLVAGCAQKTSDGYLLVPGQTCVTVVCDELDEEKSKFCGAPFAPIVLPNLIGASAQSRETTAIGL